MVKLEPERYRDAMNNFHEQRVKKNLSLKVWTAPFLVMFVAVVPWILLVAPGRAAAGPAMSAPQVGAQGGDVLFVKRCGGCHYLDEDKEGPRLRHIYGAKAGNVASFKYSSALKSWCGMKRRWISGWLTRTPWCRITIWIFESRNQRKERQSSSI